MATISSIVESAGSVVILTVNRGSVFAAGNLVQLWGLTTGVWLNGRIVTLLTGTTNTSLVFADPTTNGPQPLVSETGSALVFTPQNPLPDELYLQTRESLLPYEDARMNSLIQGVANFYMTRNDQSKWGNVLRAIAEELSRFEYFYAYDLINKLPSYLTPPDIRRRWADPCYVDSNWPSPTQFDINFKTMIVDLIAAYRMGSTAVSIQDVIFAYTGINIVVEQLYQQEGDGFYDVSDGNAIKVSVNVGGDNPLQDITNLVQLQAITESLYGAIDLAKPAHVGLEFTTVFGEGEDLDCLLSPMYITQQMYNTLSTTMQGYYELNAYVAINPTLFWKATTSFQNPNQTNRLGLVIRDSNGNLQMVTAITGNGQSGATQPTWSLITGGITTDGNVTWTNISPTVTSVEIASNTLTVTVDNTLLPTSPTPQTIQFVELGNAEFLSDQKVTVLTATPTGFTATYVNNAYVTNVEIETDTLTVLCANNFQPGMTVEFSGLLNATFLNGQSVLVDSIIYGGSPVTAIGFIAVGSSFGSPPDADYPSTADSGTAAVTDFPLTSTSGTAAYLPASTISIAQYQALGGSPPSQLQSLYQAQYVNMCCPNYLTGANGDQDCSYVPLGITDTLRIFIREVEEPPFAPMLIQAPVLGTVPAPELVEWQREVRDTLFGHEPTTTIAAWGYRLSLSPDPNFSVVTTGPTLTPAQWAALPQITFTITNVVSDGINATYTYTGLTSVAAGSPPTVIPPPYLQLHEGELVTITGCMDIGSPATDLLNGTVKINDVTSTTFTIPNPHVIPSTPQTASGNVAPLLQSAYVLQGGTYQLLITPPAPLTPYLGVTPVLTAPSNWIEIVVNIATVPNEVNLQVSGEVANWDQTHQMGLLAPRLDQVWEIQGDQYFIFEET